MTKTNAHALLTVGLRVVVVFYLVTTLPNIVVGFFTATAEIAEISRQFWIAQLIACAFFVLIWFFADKVAGVGLASRQSPVFESDADARVWLTIGIVLIGVWLASNSILSLCYYAALKWQMTHAVSDVSPREFDAQTYSELITSAAEVLLGAILALGARGMAVFLHRVRFAGMRSDASKSESVTE